MNAFKLYALLYLLSALASLINVFVYSQLGAKNHLLFIALFAVSAMYSFCCIVYYAVHWNDITTYTRLFWMTYVLEFTNMCGIAMNVIIAHVCLNLWACVQFGREYIKNIQTIHSIYIGVSIVAALVDCVIFLISSVPLSGLVSLISLFYNVIVGGISLILTLIRLVQNRLLCISILKSSNISASLLYRLMFGATLLIIIGGSNLSYDLSDSPSQITTDEEAISYLNSFNPGCLIGLGIAIVIGTSAEAMHFWRNWIKTYLGIDLNCKSNNSTVQIGKSVTSHA